MDECHVPANVPNLHRIATSSITFPNFYSASSWTPPAIYALFTSNYPFSRGGRVSIEKSDVTVAQTLHENGYYTAGLTPGAWLSKFFGFDKGFENYFDSDNGVPNKEKVYWRTRRIFIRLIRRRSWIGNTIRYLYVFKKYYRPRKSYGERLNEKALMFLNDSKGENPFFLWIHYPETHEPYFVSRRMVNATFSRMWRINIKALESARGKRGKAYSFTDADRQLLLDLYRVKLKQVDKNVADLFNMLEQGGYLSENTYVFIMGDHGQQFFDHGRYGHGIDLYQELCNVPLLIYNTSFEGKKDRRPVSGIDIAPTILDLTGIPRPAQFRGLSILESPNIKRDIILEEGRYEDRDWIKDGNRVYIDMNKYKIAVIDKRYKFIMNSRHEYELYDLETDPQELNNLAQTKVSMCENFRIRVERHLQETTYSYTKERTRQKLRSLKSRGKI